MELRRTLFAIILGITLVLPGCYMTPVRHLASDVGLLKIGVSTQEDVLLYLGEPDGKVDLGNGKQQWLYVDVDKAFYQKIPFVGKYFGDPDVVRARIVMTENIVTDCSFSMADDAEKSWSQEFSWQKKEE